jgi:hypothetical protein
MKATGYHSVLWLARCAFLTLTIADCGGKTDSATASATVGGSLAVGGSVWAQGGSQPGSIPRTSGGTRPVTSPPPAGGSSAASTVVPRQPLNVDPAVNLECTKHADCTAGTNGKCINGIGMAYYNYFCVYDECATDADCDSGKICYCTPDTSAWCLRIGDCQTDADCGNQPYSFCSPSMSSDCGGHRPIDGFHCHTAADTCFDDSDCSGSDYCNFDVYDATGKCTPTNATCIIG